MSAGSPQGVALIFDAFFTASGLGATGLTVTCDIWEAGVEIVTGGAASELGDGLYTYTLASGSVDAQTAYRAVFKTAGTADQQHVAARATVGRVDVSHIEGTDASDVLATLDDAVLAAVAALNNLSSAQAQTAAAAALTAYDPPTHAELTAGLASADDATLAAIAALNNLSASQVWAGITAAAARTIADHVLRRSWASAADSADGDALAFRSLLGAVAKLVNRVAISGATLTVYEDDDTTALGTQAVTSDADAEPITGVNTA